MSRHTIRSDEEVVVVVGWDRPLQSFFVDVYKAQLGDDEDFVVFTAGLLGVPFRIHEVRDIVELTKPWASIPLDLQLRLEAERVGYVETNTALDWTI
jgi:hypothetical protein